MGGFIAVRFAARYPERVERLVIGGARGRECDYMGAPTSRSGSASPRLRASIPTRWRCSSTSKRVLRAFLDTPGRRGRHRRRRCGRSTARYASRAGVRRRVRGHDRLRRHRPPRLDHRPDACPRRCGGRPHAARRGPGRRRRARAGRAHPERGAAACWTAAATATWSSGRTSPSRRSSSSWGRGDDPARGVRLPAEPARPVRRPHRPAERRHLRDGRGQGTGRARRTPASGRVVDDLRRRADLALPAPARLRFHSGDPCDAPAIVAALERLRWGFHDGQQLWYWDPVDTVDRRGRRRRSSSPCTIPTSACRRCSGARTPRSTTRRCGRAEPDGSATRFADGTGPFRFVSWSPERVVAERWPDYPARRPGSSPPGGRPARTGSSGR